MVVPTAFMLLCCAAISTTNDPYQYILTPNLGYAQTVLPIVVALAAVAAPVLVAREVARHGGSPEGLLSGWRLLFSDGGGCPGGWAHGWQRGRR